MTSLPDYTIQPLGDSGLLIDFGNRMEEATNNVVLQLFQKLNQTPFEGMIEAIPAYSSIAVFYNVDGVRKTIVENQTAYEFVMQKMKQLIQAAHFSNTISGRPIRVPVCYDEAFGVDLVAISEKLKLSVREIICLHTSRSYRVYMLGFLPGFPYMGEVDPKLILPRKNKPAKVTAGSVGLAGKQTGIYPLDAPGGWQIIGKTPISLFDQKNNIPVSFRAGDQITFYSISKDEFENYQGGNS
jgi:inhibitor of KinA